MSHALLVRGLYRNILRDGRRFNNYEYRQYTLRRAREEFKKYQHLDVQKDAEKVRRLVEKAQEMEGVVKRQALINSLYAKDDLIMNLKKKTIVK